MKFNSILFTVLVFLGGCGEPNLDDPETLDKILAEAIDEEKLQRRGKEGEKLVYAPNEQAPYTGWIKAMYNNGQVKGLCHFKDGKQYGLKTEWYSNGQKKEKGNYKDGMWDGLYTSWHDNGQKREKGNFKDGKLDGLYTSWHDNGQKEEEVNIKDGMYDGLVTKWHENGQKIGESICKDGKLISFKRWKQNGEKCPITNVINGTGVIVSYENGKKVGEEYYKEGKRDGLARSWNEDGELLWEQNFKDGKEVD